MININNSNSSCFKKIQIGFKNNINNTNEIESVTIVLDKKDTYEVSITKNNAKFQEIFLIWNDCKSYIKNILKNEKYNLNESRISVFGQIEYTFNRLDNFVPNEQYRKIKYLIMFGNIDDISTNGEESLYISLDSYSGYNKESLMYRVFYENNDVKDEIDNIKDLTSQIYLIVKENEKGGESNE